MSSAAEMTKLFTGPIFVATFLNWGFLGTLVVQIYSFAVNFPNERKIIKALVYVLFSLDAIETAFSTYLAWTILVSGWGDITAVISLSWASCTIPLMTGIISAMVQFFFAWRIRTFARHNIYAQGVSILILLISATQCIAGVTIGLKSALATEYTDKIANVNSLVIIWLAGSFACDVLIVVTMVILLLMSRRRVFKTTKAILNRVVINTIETGAATALTAGCELILYCYYKESLIHFIPGIILGKMYTNTVLVALNRRKGPSLSAPPTALTPSLRCSNTFCTGPNGHKRQFCVQRGGGMYGKSLEDAKRAQQRWLQEKRGDVEDGYSRPVAGPVCSQILRDAEGKAFIVEQEQIFYLQETPATLNFGMAAAPLAPMTFADPKSTRDPRSREDSLGSLRAQNEGRGNTVLNVGVDTNTTSDNELERTLSRLLANESD